MRFTKWFGISLGVLLAGLAMARPASAATLTGPAGPIFSTNTSGDYICTPQMVARDSQRCPPYGPGARQARLAHLRAWLPNPLPELPIEPLELPEDAITPYTFAYVYNLPAYSYNHPAEAEAGLPPRRQFLAGANWVSVLGRTEYNGQVWYEINRNEFITANHLAFTTPSRFRGVVLTEQPRYPFAWINRYVEISTAPSGPRSGAGLRRYEMVTIFAQEFVGEKLWYMIGPDQWIEQSFVARVDVDPRPEGVGPDERWIEIDTFEQTLAAYEGDRMVFATMASTGRPATWTPNGLNRIWAKLPHTPMINRAVSNSNPGWYYLENVEWTQYFYGAYALHAAYWHDAFGFTQSHGCVNLTILDAKWLFDWTSPYTPYDASIVQSSDSNPGTWVWVHMSDPFAGAGQ